MSHLTRQKIPKGRWECAEVGNVDCSLERLWVHTHRLDARMGETASGVSAESLTVLILFINSSTCEKEPL